MSRLLRNEVRTAKKTYPCDAFYWIDRSNYGPQDMDSEDWQMVEDWRAAGAQIKPGMLYMYQVSVSGDGFSTFRCWGAMHDLCLKYDLYPED